MTTLLIMVFSGFIILCLIMNIVLLAVKLALLAFNGVVFAIILFGIAIVLISGKVHNIVIN